MMTNQIFRSFACGTAIALVLPTAAVAELSALDVWERWKSFAESTGQTLTIGSQETDGGALILNNVQMSIEFPGGRISSSLEFLEFRERSDGTVAVTMAPDFPFSLTADPTEGEAVDMAFIFRQSGASIIASGDPDNISFDYLASEFSFGVDKIVVDDVVVDIQAEFAMNDIDGNYTLISGDTKSYASEMAAGELNYTVAFVDPDTGGQFSMNGVVEDLRSSSSLEVPKDFDIDDPAAFLAGGFSVQGTLAAGRSTSNVDVVDDEGNFAMTSSGGSSSLEFSLLDGSVQYGGSAKDIQYSVRAPQIPVPELSVGLAEVAFNLLMPLAPSDEPQDFAFLVRVLGLEVSDMIWGIFDPGAILPRDPAVISIDISGQMNWLLDITDPDLADDFGDEVPAELYSLTIDDVTLSAVGAEVTGSGEFTFDNTDLETFDGMPAPTGSVGLDIVGLFGLMDKLIQMGIMQPDQAAGLRMMTGLFARAGEGEDTLSSTLEVTGDGSIFANGQQIR